MTSGMTVNGVDLAFGEDQTCIYRGFPFTGTAVFYRTDGTLESEVEYLDGVQNGLVRDWNEASVLVLEAEVKNGAYHGRVRHFSDSGHLLREDGYEFGICIARWESLENGGLRKMFSLDSSDEAFKVLQAMRKAGQ